MTAELAARESTARATHEIPGLRVAADKAQAEVALWRAMFKVGGWVGGPSVCSSATHWWVTQEVVLITNPPVCLSALLMYPPIIGPCIHLSISSACRSYVFALCSYSTYLSVCSLPVQRATGLDTPSPTALAQMQQALAQAQAQASSLAAELAALREEAQGRDRACVAAQKEAAEARAVAEHAKRMGEVAAGRAGLYERERDGLRRVRVLD
jgi:hypothetical protein